MGNEIILAATTTIHYFPLLFLAMTIKEASNLMCFL